MSTSKANLPTGENQDEERGLASTLTSRPIGFILKYELAILRLFQIVWVPLELFLQPLLAWVFRLRGVSHYVVRRTEKGYENGDELFKEAAKILKEAKEIRIAAGEAGRQLMEHPELISSLQHAYEKNQATIEIVHGPRVDLKTRRIFDLEKQGVVSLFRMPEYERHHYILTTSLTGQVSVIDEGTHNEIVWAKDESGNEISLLTGQVRFYYIIEHSKRRVPALEEEYESRKKDAAPISEHPGLSPPQNYSTLTILADVLLNMPLKHVVQPLAILFDLPLDLLLENLYKTISGPVSRLEKEPAPIRIGGVDSEYDPESRMLCCGKPAIQKQIDYRITLNHQTFVVPNVWASVCSECDEVYFAPEVGSATDETIFEIQHPRESQLAKLLNEPPR